MRSKQRASSLICRTLSGLACGLSVTFTASGAGLVTHAADSSLDTIARGFFDERSQRRVGIEVELSGLRTADHAAILQSVLGGRIEADPYTISAKNAQGQITQHTLTKYKIRSTAIGRVVVKQEDNSLDVSNLESTVGKSPISEIVSDPITVERALLLQPALTELAKRGATGTDAQTAVSIQVNVEMNGGHPELATPKETLAILRNYLLAPNYEKIQAEWNVAESRKSYLGLYTPGFMKKLADPAYRPSWTELYNDFVYHQILEKLGHADAWSISAEAASTRLKAIVDEKGFDVLLPVMKWNHLKLGSLLIFVRPGEWLSVELEKSMWIRAIPALEFRDPNNDFNLERVLKRVIGLVEASETQGAHALPQLEKRAKKKSSIRCRAVFQPGAVE